MQLHNPTNQSRLCPGVGENLEAFEVREVADPFVKCDGCSCVASEGEFATESTEDAPRRRAATKASEAR